MQGWKIPRALQEKGRRAVNKKGSVTIFVCIFFVTLVSMILIFAGVSKTMAVRSSTDALCSLWADSVLAEYDLNLQRRYNILGYYGYPSDVKEKVEFYAGKSFDKKKYITYGVTGSSLYPYSLGNVDIMEEQVFEAGKLAFTEKFIRPNPSITPIETEEAGTAGGENGRPSKTEIFQELPSEGSEKSYSLSQLTDLLKSTGSVKDAAVKTGKSWFINQYIFAYLKDERDDKGLGTTYLQKEIEYVICGKQSDLANQRSLKNRIVTIREGMNLLYLNQDTKKSGEAMAAAALLTPGPAAAATQKAILAAWALAESVNDYKLLCSGHKVPTMKTEASWAVDLDSVLANKADGYIYTGVDIGEDYEDYLKLFLSSMNQRVKLLRVMDIIQINMRYLYYDSFLLQEYNGGVHFVLDVNGDRHEVVKCY